MQKKIALEGEKKELEKAAVEKETAMYKKLGTIGNIVHDSVPVSNNEVYPQSHLSHIRGIVLCGLVDNC